MSRCGRYTQAAVAAVFAAVLWAPSVWAGPRVRVGTYENSPKVFMAESGKPEGIFVDIIESIAKREGWELEYVFGTWPEGLDRLAAGEIDLMPDVAFTRQREAQFAFHHEPVLSDWFQVYAKGGSGIRSLPELVGKRVGVLDRSVQQESFEQAILGFGMKVTLVPFPDYSDAFAAVARGNVDAAIANRFYGVRNQRMSGIEDTAIIFSPTRLFFAAPKSGREPLLEAIDKHLVPMKGDRTSTYYQSLKRWTSESPDLPLPMWIKGLVPVAAGLLLISLLWSVVLKRQVAVRTRQLALRNEELQAACEQAEKAEQALQLEQQQLGQTNHELVRSLDRRNRAEGVLQETQSLLNDVESIAKTGGWRMDLISRKATWTQGTYDIVEIEYGLPAPGPDEHVAYYLPEYRAMVAEAMRALMEDDTALDFEAQLRTAKGNVKWCHATGRAVRENGKAIALCGTFQDITEAKRVQVNLEEQLDELRRWHDLTLGRELRVLDLKREVNELLTKAGQLPRYGEHPNADCGMRIAEDANADAGMESPESGTGRIDG